MWITTNQPHTKSNPNHNCNPTTQQHVVRIQLDKALQMSQPPIFRPLNVCLAVSNVPLSTLTTAECRGIGFTTFRCHCHFATKAPRVDSTDIPAVEKLLPVEGPSMPAPPMMFWSVAGSSRHSRFNSFRFKSRSSSRDRPFPHHATQRATKLNKF